MFLSSISLALNAVRAVIGGGPPPATYYVQLRNGDNVVLRNSDNVIYRY